MRRAAAVLLVSLVAAALPAVAAAVGSLTPAEPTSVFEPVTEGQRTERFSGDQVFLGFYEADSPTEGGRAGLVEVFTRDGDEWALATTLLPEGLGPRGLFGQGLAVDGNTLFVGVPGAEIARRPGIVQVYEQSGASWELVDSFSSPDAAKSDFFGVNIDLDGDVALVQAAGTERFHVYERIADVWTSTATLAKPDGETRFARMALAGDTIAVGSDEAIYVYVAGATGWTLQQRIPTPAEHWGQLVLSGDSLAFSDDDSALRVYRRTGGAWAYTQKLARPPGLGGAPFPVGVFMEGDLLVVGASESMGYDQAIVNGYGLLGDTWIRTDVVKTKGLRIDAVSPEGEVLIGSGAIWHSVYGPYSVYGPFAGATCQGETITMAGSNGDDVLVGTPGRDVIHGLGGNDVIDGRGGDDVLCGGPGTDTVSFRKAKKVKADLTAGTAVGSHGNDLLDGFENIIGTKGRDLLTGDAGPNVLYGMANRDTLRGMGGDDTLDGGLGRDIASYSEAPAGVQVYLDTGKSSGGDHGDLLIDMEGIVGSRFDDRLVGDDGPNPLWGQAGNDILIGGLGDDSLWGGPGLKDEIDYRDAPAGVVVELRFGRATGGDGTDRFSGIEYVEGSEFSDVLIGNSKNNRLSGRDGDDYLEGSNGNDTLLGGDHTNYYVPGPGNDTVHASVRKYGHDDIVSYEFAKGPVSVDLRRERARGEGLDRLIRIDVVIGSRYDDVIDARSGYTNLIVPFEGDDIVRAAGNGQVSYALSARGVTVDLANGTATGEGSDRLFGVRVVVGSPHADTITGASTDDGLFGMEGDDTLRGGTGDDYLDGGDDRDQLDGGYGTDHCRNGEAHTGCEYIRDQAADVAEGARSIIETIREFMELAVRYR